VEDHDGGSNGARYEDDRGDHAAAEFAAPEFAASDAVTTDAAHLPLD